MVLRSVATESRMSHLMEAVALQTRYQCAKENPSILGFVVHANSWRKRCGKLWWLLENLRSDGHVLPKWCGSRRSDSFVISSTTEKNDYYWWCCRIIIFTSKIKLDVEERSKSHDCEASNVPHKRGRALPPWHDKACEEGPHHAYLQKILSSDVWTPSTESSIISGKLNNGCYFRPHSSSPSAHRIATILHPHMACGKSNTCVRYFELHAVTCTRSRSQVQDAVEKKQAYPIGIHCTTAVKWRRPDIARSPATKNTSSHITIARLSLHLVKNLHESRLMLNPCQN